MREKVKLLQQLPEFVRSIFHIQGSIASREGERFTITCSRLAMLLRRLEALLRKGKPRSFDHLFPLRERDCLTRFFSGFISSRATERGGLSGAIFLRLSARELRAAPESANRES